MPGRPQQGDRPQARNDGNDLKVHVREIMRKLGVCNRTQVAIAAAHNGTGNGPDGVVEIIPLDSTATVKSSALHKPTMNS